MELYVSKCADIPPADVEFLSASQLLLVVEEALIYDNKPLADAAAEELRKRDD